MQIKKIIYRSIKKVLNNLPYVKTLYRQSLNCRYPNGHYYSPVFLIEDVKEREFEIWKHQNEDTILGIDLNTSGQLELVSEFYKFYNDLPFELESKPKVRYQLENGYYSFTDGIVLYSIIRLFKPRRIIEVGSGFSSMVILDTNELFFNNEIDVTFIDPHPERLYDLMKPSDDKKAKIVESYIQQIPISQFQELEKGDILFIDSTHVSKTGSDVNYILFEILPNLQSGVLIHFHDIYYPFEYPKEWVFKGINWNEDYILRAFLMYNENFTIKFFAQYLHKFHKDTFDQLPLCFHGFGSSLWIERQ